MSIKLNRSFYGLPLDSTVRRNFNVSLVCLGRKKSRNVFCSCMCGNQHQWTSQAMGTSFFYGKSLQLSRPRLRIISKVKCTKESLFRTKSLMKSLSLLWEEGFLLFRCSTIVALISGVCFLILFGRAKARSFMESKVLPSICSGLSEQIQREVSFGKVHIVSPLSIALESCSIGPHNEEFSCGEVPTIKIRICPFSSLRKGKLVIDATLAHPTMLVMQKKDYTWLGMPVTDGIFQKHLSTDEGIDYRTKRRRRAREDGFARWDKERDDAAREAAGMSYMIPEETTISLSDVDGLKEGADIFSGLPNSGSFICLTEGVTGGDHRCMDTGAQYDLKHADLENSFNIKIPGSGLNFSSSITQHLIKHKVKRKANENDLFVAHNASVKRRILERSASKAILYFSNGIISSGFADRSSCKKQMLDSHLDVSDSQTRHSAWISAFMKLKSWDGLCHFITLWTMILNSGLFSYFRSVGKLLSFLLSGLMHKLKLYMVSKIKSTISKPADELEKIQSEGMRSTFPVILDTVNIKGGTLMLLSYGDKIPRELENANGHIKFQNHYNRVHVHVTGVCKLWRSDVSFGDGGWLSTDVFIDIVEKRWHVNLRVANLFIPLFERILEIPIVWSKGRATGEVHICMSKEETFPNLNGQLDVNGMAFQIYDAPSSFFDVSTILCFRGQRIFLQNASGLFGNIPLEASGDFGIHPDEGEFHLMCQVPCVEINALMRSFKLKPLMFSLAGSITAVFNCQGPLFAPIFVGSGMVSRKVLHSVPDASPSCASEAVMKNKEAGAVAAFDRVPLSYLSANFTFNTDNCVSDLYGIRAVLVDGGEIRGAGNAWICPEGEADDKALDVNFSGNLSFLEVLDRYIPGNQHILPLKLGNMIGETKVSGCLLRPKFDIKWTVPKAEGSFSDARGDFIITHDCIIVHSSSVAFDLHMKVQTSYINMHSLEGKRVDFEGVVPIVIEGVEMDLRMFNFEFFNLDSSYPFDSPRPLHLKSSGRVKFQGKVTNTFCNFNNQSVASEMDVGDENMARKENTQNLAGEVYISALKVNQLMVAPHLIGQLIMSNTSIKLDATGRPDESLAVEVIWPLEPRGMDSRNRQLISLSLQKGQLRVNVCYRPQHLANLEVRNLPLDELELASLRGIIQRAEILLNLHKRKGHGVISVLRPKFSGVLGEALDVATRWSGNVITVEKAVLEQSESRYELQGEYVLPGTRDRDPSIKKGGGLIERAMVGHLSSVISSMGRWRMRFEVPRAEVTELLPLARLLTHSADPDVRSRSKDLFIQCLHSVGLYTERIQDLLEVIRGHPIDSDEVILHDLSLPGLAELRGAWYGSLDASGGGNGDTVAEFDFHGENWEWGSYKTQRVLAIGAYNIDDGLRLEKMFIQKDNATIHADGTLLGPKANLHFAVLNFPVSLVPTLVQILESSASLRQLLAPIKGILHMEGDFRGSLAKPECDVQIRLLDGVVGGIELGRAEIFASLTSISRFLFNAKLEPMIQNGHVHIQGSVPVTLVHNNTLDEEDTENSLMWIPGWAKEKSRGPNEKALEKKVRDKIEEGWDTQLTESLKGLNWNMLDAGEVRVNADIKDGGMMLLTALSPYADWLHGHAEIMLQVRGTVEQPVVNGCASFHRASLSSPVLWKPLTNFAGTIHVDENRLCINSLESRVGRRGKLSVKGNLPLKNIDAFHTDKIDLKCEILDVRAKNVLSGQIDSQIQIAGSILQPNISGNIKVSHGEAYLPHDRNNAVTPFNKLVSGQSKLTSDDYKCFVTSRYVSRFLSSDSAAKFTKPSGKERESEKESEQGNNNNKPKLDFRLSNLKLVLGPELKIVYPLILNFAVSGELELNGVAHPKWIKPKGILTFENGDVNLVATQVRLKREHLNIAKFEPDNGLDPMLDLALVGSEWQFRIQSKGSNWQDKLVVTSTRSVEQDVLSPTEAARVFESQLAGSILEGDGQLALKKLVAATLERLMPRIEGKGEFGQARWSLVYAPQIPTLLSVDPSLDPLRSLASNISFGTEVEVQLGKRLQASIVRQMKDSEMAMQWTLMYQLTSRLRVLLQSAPSKRLLFEYSATSQD